MLQLKLSGANAVHLTIVEIVIMWVFHMYVSVMDSVWTNMIFSSMNYIQNKVKAVALLFTTTTTIPPQKLNRWFDFVSAQPSYNYVKCMSWPIYISI